MANIGKTITNVAKKVLFAPPKAIARTSASIVKNVASEFVPSPTKIMKGMKEDLTRFGTGKVPSLKSSSFNNTSVSKDVKRIMNRNATDIRELKFQVNSLGNFLVNIDDRVTALQEDTKTLAKMQTIIMRDTNRNFSLIQKQLEKVDRENLELRQVAMFEKYNKRRTDILSSIGNQKTKSATSAEGKQDSSFGMFDWLKIAGGLAGAAAVGYAGKKTYDRISELNETTRAAASAAVRGARVTTKLLTPAIIRNSISKIIAPSLAKLGAKKIPVIGALLGGASAAYRLYKGDKTGAAMEVGSGLSSFNPAASLTVGLGLDLMLIARDVYKDIFGTYPGDTPEDKQNMDTIVEEVKKYLKGEYDKEHSKSSNQTKEFTKDPAELTTDKAVLKILEFWKSNPELAGKKGPEKTNPLDLGKATRLYHDNTTNVVKPKQTSNSTKSLSSTHSITDDTGWKTNNGVSNREVVTVTGTDKVTITSEKLKNFNNLLEITKSKQTGKTEIKDKELILSSDSPHTIILDSETILFKKQGVKLTKNGFESVAGGKTPEWAKKVFDESYTEPKKTFGRRNYRTSGRSFVDDYIDQKTIDSKQDFLAYGKLPKGFEFLPGHMGTLGSPGAVMARGAMPYSGGGYSVGGGESSGGGGSGYSGGGFSGGGGGTASTGQPTQEDEYTKWAGKVGKSQLDKSATNSFTGDSRHPLAQQRIGRGGDKLSQSEKLHFYALAMAEMGSVEHLKKRGIDPSKAYAALMETAYNRGMTEPGKRNKSITASLQKDYYEPLRSHTKGFQNYNNYLRQLKQNPELFKQLENAHNMVLGGSNFSNYATQNSSAGVAASARRTQSITSTEYGETLSRKDRAEYSSLHGAGTIRESKKWHEQTRAAVAEWEKSKREQPPVKNQEGELEALPQLSLPPKELLNNVQNSKKLNSGEMQNVVPYKGDANSFGKLSAAPSLSILRSGDLAQKFPEGSVRFFREAGNMKGLSPKLVEVLKEASKDLPSGYHVRMFSGADARRSGTLNHPGGVAVDVAIVDSNGKRLKPSGFGEGNKIYEQFAQSMNIRGQKMFPGTKYIHGGAWISQAAGYGDRMHYQIIDPEQPVRGASKNSGQYSFEKGISPGFRYANAYMSPQELKQYQDKIRNTIDLESKGQIQQPVERTTTPVKMAFPMPQEGSLTAQSKSYQNVSGVHPLQDEKYRITSRYGPRRSPTSGASSNHKGVDYGVAMGTPIKSIMDGKVTFAGTQRGYGYIVEVEHEDGTKSRYAHLSDFKVKQGDVIKKGQVLALSGGAKGHPGAGTSTGPHLHFEIIQNGQKINPLPFLESFAPVNEVPRPSTQDVDMKMPSTSTILSNINEIERIKRIDEGIPVDKIDYSKEEERLKSIDEMTATREDISTYKTIVPSVQQDLPQPSGEITKEPGAIKPFQTFDASKISQQGINMFAETPSIPGIPSPAGIAATEGAQAAFTPRPMEFEPPAGIPYPSQMNPATPEQAIPQPSTEGPAIAGAGMATAESVDQLNKKLDAAAETPVTTSTKPGGGDSGERSDASSPSNLGGGNHPEKSAPSPGSGGYGSYGRCFV